MTEQMRFNFEDARNYMRQTFGFEEERDALNARITDARSVAREMGVPTKAVELAVRAERNHRKAIALVSQEEFEALRLEASILVEMQEAARELARTGASALSPR